MAQQEKKKLTGGDVLIKCLLQEDVKYLMGVPGGQFLPMYDAIYQWGKDKGIQTVMFRHEQAAAHAADAYARVTNKPGVCFGTVGPGAMHLVPGIGTAWSDNIPIVAIVPQINIKLEDTFTLQGNLDQITMFKPITKYQRSIRNVEKIPDAVQKCFREAMGGRPRPVLLELYEDAISGTIEEDKIPIFPKDHYRAMGRSGVDPDLVKKALELLLSAQKPLILAGGGVMRAEGWNELKEFAEYLQMPVITSVMGMGTMDNKSKCYIGASVAGAGMKAAPESDVVLALGIKFSYTMAHGVEPFWKNSQTLIQVDIDSSIIGRSKPVSLGIVGDCKLFLKQILEEAKKTKKVEKREWLETLIAVRQKSVQTLIKKGSKDKVPIHPQRLVKDVLEFMDEDAILIFDGGDIACYVQEQADIYKKRNPLSTVNAIGMGHLGTAVPYGIGAKLGQPNKQVVAVAGDGSFLMNIQDLETAVRLGFKNLIYVIGNNSAWGMIKSGQKLAFGKRYIDVDFPPFDFGKCAQGFGCYGETVTEPKDIKPALERAKNSGKPAVIDVKIEFDTPDSTKLMGSMGML